MPASDRSQRRPTPSGRPIFGAIAGAVLGILVAADLVLASAIRFDSPSVTALPLVGAVLGFTLGWIAPLRRRTRTPQTPLLDMVVETDEPDLPATSDLRTNG